MRIRVRICRVLVPAVICFVMGFAFAQDVGMGTRTGGASRFEEPYTLEIETPHVKWAKPLPDGPIRLLAVPSVQEGRTLVEIAQRVDLELTTVTIDPAWDNNKWTMSFGDDYGARAERGDLKLIYKYLEEELTGDADFDVILLPLSHGWEALSPSSRKALEERVRGGCGLVLIRPLGGDISPLIPATPVSVSDERYRQVEPDSIEGLWKRASQHYIIRGIPVESFPFEFLAHYRYKLGDGAEPLVVSDTGEPVIAWKQFGNGRVLALGYRNIGISWRMDEAALGQSVDLHWEYFYSLLVRSLLYAAGREPSEPASFGEAGSRWILRRETGEVVGNGSGPPPGKDGLLPGRYFIEEFSGPEWRISPFDVEQPDRIESVGIDREVVSEGDRLHVQFYATNSAVVTLGDGFGRVLAEGKTEGDGNQELYLTVGKPLTHGGFLSVQVGTAVKRQPVRYQATSREWKDYEVILPWYGPRSYQPWVPALDEQFRKIGITTLSRPNRNFRIIASVHEPVFGIYWYRRAEYEERKREYLSTGDKRFIRRNVSLHTPTLYEDMKKRFLERVESLIPLKPFAYYIADESSLTCYADAFDVDFSPEDLAAFRVWLKGEYESLVELNKSWGTTFTDWDGVIPMTTEEAQEHGNYASWSDHRVFMEKAFLKTFSMAEKMVHEIDPEARASFSGTQVPTPHNGANWFEIDKVADYLQPYSGGNQDSMHHLFNPDLKLTGFTGYGLVGDEVQEQVWRRLFYGHSGASIFWHYTLLNPDLTLSSQGAALAQAFRKMQSGIGRIFMNSAVIEDGVAIHYSMASIRGAWITDGKIVDRVVPAQRTSDAFSGLMKSRDEWVSALEKRGAQFRFLDSSQIESGGLKGYKALILPYSISLSDREIHEIEEFAGNGGTVFFDQQAGRMDERLHWRTPPAWEGKENFELGGPVELSMTLPIPVECDSLTTIRGFGESKLIGVLPAEKTSVEVPQGKGAMYDLLHGGLARKRLEISPSSPLILLERPSAIAAIEVQEDLTVRLFESDGSPVDRSVVTVDVYDPEGTRIHYYSCNIDVLQGRGKINIPWALNDSRGEWSIRVRDVISGKTDSVTVLRNAG